MERPWTVVAKRLMLPLILFFTAAQASVASDSKPLAEDNTGFACDLYQKLRVSDGNLFFSPYSISAALAMTYAGARGDTESQMAKTMRFSMNQDVHPAFAELAAKLAKLQKSGNVKLSIANSLWPQQEYAFLDSYLSLVRKYYGVSVTPLDYKSNPESSRKTINGWVEKETREKIKDLIQPGILDSLTRLVLVNAIYFHGNWEHKFMARGTKDAPFHVTADQTVQAPMMTQQEEFGYATLDSLAMLELPYAGNEVSMLILLPKETEGLKPIEADLSLKNINRWKSRLSKKKVLVFLPKFKMTSSFRMDHALISLGMVDAFSDTKANFAGMDGRSDWLYIRAVLHKAFVDVNEEGTEAAAATAAPAAAKGMPTPPPTFRADHPFLFLIQENQTGSILFIGRMTDPTKAGE